MNLFLNKKELITLLWLIAKGIDPKLQKHNFPDFTNCLNYELVTFLKQILKNPTRIKIGKNIINEKIVMYCS